MVNKKGGKKHKRIRISKAQQQKPLSYKEDDPICANQKV